MTREHDVGMPSRGRHQSSSSECLRAIRKIEAMTRVTGVIIGRSYGGKSLGQNGRTGSIRVQREVSGGLKAVTQTSKGLQELFIRTEEGAALDVWKAIEDEK
ncbi:hypothetical protein NT6N_31950 [Oceaniferula spumae]|uniref:Uncharacterized protein n=1 Tax=Oceaniferula spumae TaxID=2979115 RepID=A0AAT9FQ51_9BACT